MTLSATQSTSTRAASADWPKDAAPQRLIERLFTVLSRRYGARLADMWRGEKAGLGAVKQQWGLDLADLTAAEWRIGIVALRDRPFVPNCPEFRLLCRPRENVDALLDIAIAQLHRRQLDGTDVWPDPALFWAAQRVGGYEMRTLGRDMLAKRFAIALEAVRTAGNVQPVPAASIALPAPGQTVTDEATAKARLAALLHGRPGRSKRSLSRMRETLLPIADRDDAVGKLLPPHLRARMSAMEKQRRTDA